MTARGPAPEVSVLIATVDRADILRQTLRALEGQEIERSRWELIVVDNGSTDETPALLREPRDLPLTALEEPARGKNRALNRALRFTSGALIVFTDDDVLPEPHWLAQLLKATRRWPGHAVFGGRVTLALPSADVEWIFELPDPAVNFGRFAPRSDEGITDRTPTGANFAVRADVLRGLRFCEDIGPDGTRGYTMGSETEMLKRLMALGHEVVYVPDATVRHVVQAPQLELSNLFARSFRMGRSHARLGSASEPVPYLLGVPRYLWRQWAAAASGYLRAHLASPKARLSAGLEFHRLRGLIAEHRRLAASRPQAPPAAPR